MTPETEKSPIPGMFSNKRGNKLLATLTHRKKNKVFSDHKPLEKLNLKARTDEELGDLTYYLSQFNFEVIYKGHFRSRQLK